MREAIRLRRLVAQLRQRGIRHEGVLRAMGEIPRTWFVDEALQGKAYADAALPIGEGQTISQPWIVARMSELLEPDGRGRVLEIGTGSGYHAAVLSRLFEQVFSVERIPALAERAGRRLRALGVRNVHCKVFDGGYGWPEFAPYRAVVVTAAARNVPQPLLEQLELEGRLVAPVEQPGTRTQILVRWIRTAQGLRHEEHGPCRFVPLRGRFGQRADA